MPETTDKEFKLFKSELKKWVEKLNLRSWDWYTETGDIGENYGGHEARYTDRIINVFLTSDALPEENREKIIKQTAFHEVVEGGLLGRLRIIAENRDYRPEEIESEIHAIINRLQNLLL